MTPTLTTSHVNVFIVPVDSELASLREGATGGWYDCPLDRYASLAAHFMAAAFAGGNAVEVVASDGRRADGLPTHDLQVRR